MTDWGEFTDAAAIWWLGRLMAGLGRQEWWA